MSHSVVISHMGAAFARLKLGCYNGRMKIPVIAAALSLLLPGLGQLANRERAKGMAMLVMVAGMGVSALLAHSRTAAVLMGLLYLAVLIPSVLDAYQVAAGRSSRFGGGSRGYVIVMLITVGPFALPLLWQSPRFSRPPNGSAPRSSSESPCCAL